MSVGEMFQSYSDFQLPVKRRKKRSRPILNNENKGHSTTADNQLNPILQVFTPLEDIEQKTEEIGCLHQSLVAFFCNKSNDILLRDESFVEDISFISEISCDLKRYQLKKSTNKDDVQINAEDNAIKNSAMKDSNLEAPGEHVPNLEVKRLPPSLPTRQLVGSPSGCASSSKSLRGENQNPCYNNSVYTEENYAAKEKKKAMDERCIVYVGNIPNGYSTLHLRSRFKKFGTIKDIQIKKKVRNGFNSPYSSNLDSEKMRNYGFITFSSNQEATAAIEKGNDKEKLKFLLSFGARRQFVGQDYKDLDGMEAKKGSSCYEHNSRSSFLPQQQKKDFKEVLAEYINSKNMHGVA